jgi:hypothetical protein
VTTSYLLSIYQPDGPIPDPETLAAIGAKLHELNEEIRASGSWVFTGGLYPPDTATVVRGNGTTTDGPYLEGKEHIGGFWVITAAHLDAALVWARKAAEILGLPIEVRPFQDVAPL